MLCDNNNNKQMLRGRNIQMLSRLFETQVVEVIVKPVHYIDIMIIYIYIYIHISVSLSLSTYVYVYIYIYTHVSRSLSLYINIYIYIYIYMYTCTYPSLQPGHDGWCRSARPLITRGASVFNKSNNFTSDSQIRMPPTIPVNHYLRSRNQQNRTEVLSYYSMLMYSRRMPA